MLIGVLALETLTRGLSEKGKGVKWAIHLGLAATLIFVAWAPTRSMLTESSNRRVTFWDPFVTETIERHSKPGDYVLAPGVPVLLVALDRKNPYPLGGPTDDVLPYLPAAVPTLQMEALRHQLESNLPKVCYFVEWFRPQQQRWHELLYDPLLVKYHYVQVDEGLWYLPEGN
jgi:hypothetical protein